MNRSTAYLWFSDGKEPFKGTEPNYFDTSQFDWVTGVESRWREIRDELVEVVRQDESIMIPYVDKAMASRPNKWRTLGLMFWTRRSVENCQRFPKTWSIVKDISGLTAVSFNLLEPNTTIKPHVGNTNAIIRCHMGLIIPAQAPRCAFRVGSETRSWEPGKFLMFCDAHEHTAWNNTSEQRYILVLDVIRPEFARSVLSISARVLTGIYQEAVCQRWAAMRKLSGSRAGHTMLAAGLRAFCSVVLRASRSSWT